MDRPKIDDLGIFFGKLVLAGNCSSSVTPAQLNGSAGEGRAKQCII